MPQSEKMYYKKLKVGETTIEFHNNWLGMETVIVGGQVVSSKGSLMGTHHHFTVIEDGHNARYVLTTKTNGIQIFIDLRRNGELIKSDVLISIASKPQNKYKKKALMQLNEYELDEALENFQTALDFDSDDAEIYFHMACAYSVLEDTSNAYNCIKKAVAKGLPNSEMILNHPMLAFLRMDDGFENFYNSGCKELPRK